MKKQIIWVVREHERMLDGWHDELFTTKELAEDFVKRAIESDEILEIPGRTYSIFEQILWDCIPNLKDSEDTYERLEDENK